MKTTNKVAFNTTLIEKAPTTEIKKLVNNKLARFGNIIGNASFMIKPSCIIYDKDKGGYCDRTELVIGRGIFNNLKDIMQILERSELKEVPRVYISGKYNAMTQALAQAKYNYPDRFIIIKRPYTAFVVIYRTDLNMFMAIEPYIIKASTPPNIPSDFNVKINGDII